MDKKGMDGMDGLGGFIMVFVLVIVGVTLFLSVAQITGTATSTANTYNDTITSTASSVQNLDGQAVSGLVTVKNESSGTTIPTSLYTVADKQVVNGELTSTITINATGKDVGKGWNLSYTYEPDGYMSGASRSLALLIPIMFALAILVVAMTPALRNNLLEKMGK